MRSQYYVALRASHNELPHRRAPGLVLQEVIRFFQSRVLGVHHAIRKAGIRSLFDARVVILENDGDWSVIARRDGPSDESALYGLPTPGRSGNSRGDDGAIAQPADAHRLP